MALLKKKEIQSVLHDLPMWKLKTNMIRRKYEFKDFIQAMAFVNSVAILSERVNHHPDIEIYWNRVILSLSTHSEGGITRKDVSLARKIDFLIEH